MAEAASFLLDLGEAELQAVLSPRSNLKLLADAATQRQEAAVGGDDSVCTVFDRAVEKGLVAGSSVAGRQSGTVEPGSSVSFGGSLGLAGEGGPSDLAASHDIFRIVVRRSDNVQESSFSGHGVERCSLSTGRRSQRMDRELGCRSDDVGPSAEECANHVAERRATSQRPRRNETPARFDHADSVKHVLDGGMSRNFKSYAVGMKLGTYDGSSSLETFLAKFENCSEYSEWTDADRLYHLRASLEGPAGQLLWSAPKEATVDTVIKLLKNRFGNLHQQERCRAELKSRKRRSNESL